MSDSESEDDLTPTTVETLHAHIKEHAVQGDEWTRHIRVWRQPAGQKETREEKLKEGREWKKKPFPDPGKKMCHQKLVYMDLKGRLKVTDSWLRDGLPEGQHHNLNKEGKPFSMHNGHYTLDHLQVPEHF